MTNTNVFDDLDPSQFHFAGTAVIDETFENLGDFFTFIDWNKVAVRMQYAAAEGNPNPVIVLANGTNIRGYVATDTESLEDFAERLGKEAREMSANRLFFYRKTKVAALSGVTPTAQKIREAGESIDAKAADYVDMLHDGIIWYAETTEEDDVTHVSGILELAGSERLVDNSLMSTQAITVLDRILKK